MRQLRYAGPGEDATQVVVEAVDGHDRYTLVLDDALRAAARQELPRLDRADSEQVTLSPREIQTRVRAGASPEAVAEEAGLPLEKVMRFAYPVLQERVRVADEARRARARRTTPTGEMAVFGEIVDGRLAAHEIDPAEVAWDSYRRLDGQWTVTAGWREADTDRFAQWSFALASRVISPLDETAADLLSDRPLRPVGGVEPEPEDELTVGGAYAEQVPADPGHPTGPIPGGLRLAGPPRSASDRSAPADRADPFQGADWPAEPTHGGAWPTDRAPTDRASTDRAPTDRASTDRAPTDRAPAAAPAAPAATPPWPADPAPRGLGSFFNGPVAVPTAPADVPVDATVVDPSEPLLPFAFEALDANAPAGRRFRPARHEGDADEENPDGKAARARIPSWDDILLGVRRRTD